MILDAGRMEVVDATKAEVLLRKTPAERVAVALDVVVPPFSVFFDVG